MTALAATLILAIHQLEVVNARLQDALTLADADIEDRVPLIDTVHGRPAGITTREQQVLQLVAQGLSNEQVADRLGLAEQTVKGRLYIVYRKLHVRTRIQAVLLARDLGLVTEVTPQLTAADLREGPNSRLGENRGNPWQRSRKEGRQACIP